MDLSAGRGVDGFQIKISGQIQLKNIRWFAGNKSTGDGGSSSFYLGFQGRKDLVLTMPNCLAQNHCSNWFLSRLVGVCGKGGGGTVCDTLLMPTKEVVKLVRS